MLEDLLYKKYIEELANSESSEEFYNSSEIHAITVLKTIVKNSCFYLKIYCGNMCSPVSSDSEYHKAMESFLLRNGKIEIIFSNQDNTTFPRTDICKLFKKYRTQVVIKALKNSKDIILGNGNPVHFTVADDKMYRLETDIIKKKARGNFNNNGNALVLKNIFDQLFRDDDKVDLINLEA